MTKLNYYKYILIFTTIICYTLPVYPDVKQHNLLDIYELALKNDATFSAVKAGTQAIKEEIPLSRSLLLPNVQVSANTQHNDIQTHIKNNPNAKDRHNSHGWIATVEQPIFNLKNWITHQKSQNIGKQASLELFLEQQNLIIRIIEAYFNILYAIDDLGTAVSEEKALLTQLNRTTERYKVGLISEADKLDAQSAYDNAYVNKIQKNNNLSTAYEKIREITNTPILAIGYLKKNFPLDTLPSKFPEPWEKKALRNNISLKIAKYKVLIAEQKIKAQKSDHAPIISVFASYGYTSSNSKSMKQTDHATNLEYTGDSTQKIIGLKASIPIFSGFSTVSKVKYENYLLEEAQHNLDKKVRETITTIRSLLLTIISNIKQIKARYNSILSAKSALIASQNDYDVGKRTITDVLNNQKNFFSAQRDLLQTRYTFILNTFKLKQQAGSLSPNDVSELNQWITFSKSDSISEFYTSFPET